MIAALSRIRSQFLTISLLSTSLFLASCGGGGSGESASIASDPNRNTGEFTGSGSSSSSSSGSTATGTDVLTYHNDRMRTGQNLTEAVLTPANVTSATFGLLRTLAADDAVDAALLIATNVSSGGSAHTVVYAATESDSVYAYDADGGALLLHVSLLASGETPSDTRSCGQVAPAIGITSKPVIDRSVGPNGTIFMVAMSKDSGGAYHQRPHALDLTTGRERYAPA